MIFLRGLVLFFLIATSASAGVYDELMERYSSVEPLQWGEKIEGVLSSFKPRGSEVALTLDACGGPRGNGYDSELIDWLREEGIVATLFVSARWAKANEEIFRELARDENFEVANHGLNHRPCGVTPRRVYGIKATGSLAETIKEIAQGSRELGMLGASPPRFFRPGTAWLDDVALRIASDLGQKVVGYSIAGDLGATLHSAEVARRVQKAQPGDILLLHFNRPDSGTAEGLKIALEALRRRGLTFVKLSDLEKLREHN